MIARCSKYDFLNLGEIWDRNRLPKKIGRTNIRRKKSENFWSKKKLVEIFGWSKILFDLIFICCEEETGNDTLAMLPLGIVIS